MKHTTLVAGLLCAFGAVVAPSMAQQAPVNPRFDESLSPPWQHGANNDTADRGLDFTVPDADNLADFHGNPVNPKLTLYVGGNIFFAMPALIQTFEKQHPQYKGRIYWETIPPGLLMKQLKAGGTITVGNMTWTAKPDIYMAGLKKVQDAIQDGTLQSGAVPYVTNTLAIMVPKGNPAHVTGLVDLGKPDIKLVMPNPQFEGVARQIKAALTKAGGPQLVTMVYETKLKDGSTELTHIHHRQTPLWIMQGRAQAGVAWLSESLFQEQIGHPIEHVEIPAAQNSTAIYAGAVVKNAAHQKAGQEWLEFLRSPASLAIFERYGFRPYTAPSAK